ncbi:MAG TPA: endonuclease/exonuclease/phosphatase family protein [Vicinamibacterales bacterium]|nr:endonuclease/exonuclease/phosphatase family protein [Vicinamibacterales bacterium]
MWPRRIAVLLILPAGLAVAAVPSTTLPVAFASAEPECTARVTDLGDRTIQWLPGPAADVDALDQWCRAVGPPVYIPTPSSVDGNLPPPVEALTVLTWNAHLAEGRLDELVRALRDGRFTNGAPVTHFVLLVQELFRRADVVPAFLPGARSAFAIRARAVESPDVNEYARELGLSVLYVPSMRNGAELFEDRGNAIVSTEPLSQPIALELPFERQRRVTIGAAIDVMRHGVRSTLRIVDAHLEPLSSPRSLWVFRNPRERQIAAILDFLSGSRFEDDVAWAGTVLGGDFNTIQGGIDEQTYRDARAWGTSTVDEDRRGTHYMGRLDYLFFRLPDGWIGTTKRLAEKFGSDHHPVLGTMRPAAGDR